MVCAVWLCELFVVRLLDTWYALCACSVCFLDVVFAWMIRALRSARVWCAWCPFSRLCLVCVPRVRLVLCIIRFLCRMSLKPPSPERSLASSAPRWLRTSALSGWDTVSVYIISYQVPGMPYTVASGTQKLYLHRKIQSWIVTWYIPFTAFSLQRIITTAVRGTVVYTLRWSPTYLP